MYTYIFCIQISKNINNLYILEIKCWLFKNMFKLFTAKFKKKLMNIKINKCINWDISLYVYIYIYLIYLKMIRTSGMADRLISNSWVDTPFPSARLFDGRCSLCFWMARTRLSDTYSIHCKMKLFIFKSA